MKLGILGGSFNPVHYGHLRMAVEALERLGLDRVNLVPAGTPPHKPAEGMLPFRTRLGLVRLGVYGIDGLGSDPLEGARPGPSFTCDTLTCMQTKRPQADLHFILGTGTFLELHNWKRGLELPQWTNLVVVNRWERSETEVADFVAEHWPDVEPMADSPVGGWRFSTGNALYMLDMPRLDIKAGDIRERWRQRRRLQGLTPDSVRRALEKGGPEYEEAWGTRADKPWGKQ